MASPEGEGESSEELERQPVDAATEATDHLNAMLGNNPDLKAMSEEELLKASFDDENTDFTLAPRAQALRELIATYEATTGKKYFNDSPDEEPHQA